MRALAGFTPNLEIYSIDEAFLSFAGFDTRLEAHARELRRTCSSGPGFRSPVGIAPTKTLPKVGNAGDGLAERIADGLVGAPEAEGQR
jgi:DNA polymerase V